MHCEWNQVTMLLSRVLELLGVSAFKAVGITTNYLLEVVTQYDFHKCKQLLACFIPALAKEAMRRWLICRKRNPKICNSCCQSLDVLSEHEVMQVTIYALLCLFGFVCFCTS
jgi:hypothetical protein